MHATPTAGDDLMSGPEIQANAIWTATHGLPLRDARRRGSTCSRSSLLALAPAFAGLRARPLAVALVAPLVGVVWRRRRAARVQRRAGSSRSSGRSPRCCMGTTGTIAARYLAELTERRRVTVYSELLERRVHERTEELRETQLEVVRRLAPAAESRDGDTGAHIERMSRLCERLALADRAGASRTPSCSRHASALHDVGKIGIPDRVLLKPGKLDREECDGHADATRRSARRCSPTRAPRCSSSPRPSRRTHHERWDGTGYPRRPARRGDPARRRGSARSATSSTRSSRRAPLQGGVDRCDDALAEIVAQRGRHFDPAARRGVPRPARPEDVRPSLDAAPSPAATR